MIALARRSGDLRSIDAHVVHANDQFSLEYGLEQKLTHVPCLNDDPGEMVGAYCVVHLADTDPQFLYMTKREIDAHRRRSKASSSGPWVTDYEAMALKTVVRAIFKFLPVSIDVAKADAADGNVVNYNMKSDNATELDDMIEVSFVTPDSEVSEAENQAENGK